MDQVILVWVLGTMCLLWRQVGAVPEVVASGYSLEFDGESSFGVIENRDLEFVHEEFTMSVWVKMNADKAVRGRDYQVMGAPSETGTKMFISEGQLALFWPFSTITSECDSKPFIKVDDGEWHHLLVLLGRDSETNVVFGEAYTDGIKLRNCSKHDEDRTFVYIPFYRFQIGINDPQQPQAQNSGYFVGEMDHIQYFDRALTEVEIQQLFEKGFLGDSFADSKTKSANMPLFQFTFDENGNNYFSDGSLEAEPKLSVDFPTLANVPKKSVSTCPIFSGSLRSRWSGKEWIDQEAAEQLQIPILSTDKFSIATFSNILGTANITLGSRLITTQPRDFSVSLNLNASTSERMTFNPTNETGFAQGDGFDWSATLVLADESKTITSEPISVGFSRRTNSPPQAGSGGQAIFCDGNDYAANYDFNWPMKTFTHEGNRTINGGEPITVEFWTYFNESSEGDVATFSIGDGESPQDWVDRFNPFRKNGRFVVMLPRTKGEGDIFVGNHNLKVTLGKYYNSWVHVALVAEQAGGKTMKLYLNGELAAMSLDTDYAGLGVALQGATSQIPVNKQIKSFTLCGWQFWSGVNFVGLIDEMRVWRGIRTEEQIKENMYRSLDVVEGEVYPDLFAYWDFDDAVHHMNPDLNVLVDRSKNGKDLSFSSCAPCIDTLKSFGAASCPCLDEKTDDDIVDFDKCFNQSKRCDIDVSHRCEPSDQSLFVYGGFPCYSSGPFAAHHLAVDPSKIPDTNPTRLVSSAPIGGRALRQHIAPYAWYSYRAGEKKIRGDISIKLNATDTDGDSLRFGISKLPSRGSIYINKTNEFEELVQTAPFFLPVGVDTVYFVPTKDFEFGTVPEDVSEGALQVMGGESFSSFEFFASDGLAESEAVQVTVDLGCPIGTFWNRGNFTCLPCPPGTSQALLGGHFSQECVKCPFGSSQPMSGQSRCAICDQGTFSDLPGSVTCTECTALPRLDPSMEMNLAFSECFREAKFDGDDDFLIVVPQETVQEHVDEHIVHMIETASPQIRLWQVDEDGKKSESINVGEQDINLLQYASAASSDASKQDEVIDQATGNTTLVSTAARLTGIPDLRFFETNFTHDPEKQIVHVTVSFDHAGYFHSLRLFGPPSNIEDSLIRVEAFDSKTDSWNVLWHLGEASSSHTYIEPSICPTAFLSDTLKLFFRGTVVLDAVAVLNTPTLEGLPTSVVLNSRGMFALAPGDSSIYGLNQTLTLSLIKRHCGPVSDGPEAAAFAGTMDPLLTERKVAKVQVEIEPEFYPLDPAAAIAAIVLAGTGAVLVIFTLIVVFQHRNTALILATTPLFAGLMLVALLFIFIWIILLGIDYLKYQDPGYFCVVSPWILLLSFEVCFWLLLAKTWRIKRLFNNKRLLRLKITQMQMLKVVIPPLLLSILFLTVWTVFDPLTNKLVPHDVYKIYTCTCENFLVWIIIVCVLVGIPAFFGVYLSWKVRNVKILNFNESVNIGIAIYSIVFCGLISLIALSLEAPEVRNAKFGIIAFSVWIVGMTTLVSLFGPKLYVIFFDPEKVDVLVEASNSSTSHQNYGKYRSGTASGAFSKSGLYSSSRRSPSMGYQGNGCSPNGSNGSNSSNHLEKHGSSGSGQGSSGKDVSSVTKSPRTTISEGDDVQKEAGTSIVVDQINIS